MPEQYNQYGEIQPEKPKVYTRTLNGYDQHRIHETKDLFESSCTYCQDRAKKLMESRERVSMWGNDE